MKIKLICIFLSLISLLTACNSDNEESDPLLGLTIYEIYVKGSVIYNKRTEYGRTPTEIEGIKVQLIPSSKDNIDFDFQNNTAITDKAGKYEVRLRSFHNIDGAYSILFQDIDGSDNGDFEKSEMQFHIIDSKPIKMYEIPSPTFTGTWVMFLKGDEE